MWWNCSFSNCCATLISISDSCSPIIMCSVSILVFFLAGEQVIFLTSIRSILDISLSVTVGTGSCGSVSFRAVVSCFIIFVDVPVSVMWIPTLLFWLLGYSMSLKASNDRISYFVFLETDSLSIKKCSWQGTSNPPRGKSTMSTYDAFNCSASSNKSRIQWRYSAW